LSVADENALIFVDFIPSAYFVGRPTKIAIFVGFRAIFDDL
jgi:hypothetical protein